MNQILCFNKIQSEMYTQKSTEYAFISAGDHAFYITKNGTLLCDVTMTIIRQEKKMETSFFLNSIYVSSKKNEYKSLLPKNVQSSPNFVKAACTKSFKQV